ncbi:MAG: hypothetical protein ACFFCW_40910 [Candidatus Hodarchaeota archaeon]
MKLRARESKESSIETFVGAIKQVCTGKLPHGEIIEGWGLKHPNRLTLQEALGYISELQTRELQTRRHRLALRNFLKSKGVQDWDDITGKIEHAGKYAHLNISKQKVYEIFDWLRTKNENAYKASKFGYKTASRIRATLSAHAKRMNFEEHTIIVIEKATRGKGKRYQEKVIPDDLWEELPKEGKLFDIKADELRGLLRSAYKEIIPELVDEIPMPFHFWRHQFAQHMLRATGWNYGLVARLGHWTVETLERYYGEMDRQTAFREAQKFLPLI